MSVGNAVDDIAGLVNAVCGSSNGAGASAIGAVATADVITICVGGLSFLHVFCCYSLRRSLGHEWLRFN